MSDLDKVEQHLIDISGNQWKEISTKVMWLHRLKRDNELPEVLYPISRIALDPDAWKILRNQINRKRKAAYRQKLKERRDTKLQERRNYMRSYMATYRKRD